MGSGSPGYRRQLHSGRVSQAGHHYASPPRKRGRCHAHGNLQADHKKLFIYINYNKKEVNFGKPKLVFPSLINLKIQKMIFPIVYISRLFSLTYAIIFRTSVISFRDLSVDSAVLCQFCTFTKYCFVFLNDFQFVWGAYIAKF